MLFESTEVTLGVALNRLVVTKETWLASVRQQPGPVCADKSVAGPLRRHDAGFMDPRALGVALFPGHNIDKECLREPMRSVDGVFHIAGWHKIGARDNREAQRINIGGTRNVREVMRDLHTPGACT